DLGRGHELRRGSAAPAGRAGAGGRAAQHRDKSARAGAARLAGKKTGINAPTRRNAVTVERSPIRIGAANPSPWFFVSVASKGLRVYVSGLESTLAGISTSVDSKEVARTTHGPRISTERGSPGLNQIHCIRESRRLDRKSTRLNSSHDQISYAVFC